MVSPQDATAASSSSVLRASPQYRCRRHTAADRGKRLTVHGMHTLRRDTHSSDAYEPGRFDASSGSRLERLIFNHRGWVLAACALLSVLFVHQLRGLAVSASFEQTLPQNHPYIRNYL